MNRQRINSIRNHINNSRENRDRVDLPQLFLNQPLGTQPASAESSTSNVEPGKVSGEDQTDEQAPFAPTFADVRVARAILKSFKVPTELALAILDLAHYWPEQTFISTRSSSTSVGGSISEAKSVLALAGPVLGDEFAKHFVGETPKVKEVEVVIKSHDQGWTSQGGHGTYKTSSWTELSILHNKDVGNSLSSEGVTRRLEENGNPLLKSHAIKSSGWEYVTRPESAERYPQGDDEPIAWYLQANKVATPITNAKVVWGKDRYEGNEGSGSGEGFLDALERGDIILLWARAKWRGWECYVTYVKITVRFGF